MGQAWSTEQVLALAPDASSVAAGRTLARTSAWLSTGADAAAVWGECQGSGRTPYVTMVDVAGPAYRCSCPSRKFPCKHALGLLLLWTAGGVPAATAPDAVTAWLAERAGRADRSERAGAAKNGTDDPTGAGGADAAAAKDAGPADLEAAARRVEQRNARMAAGLDDLRRWLLDQVRAGLAGRERSGYAEFDTVAARLVDAQVPGVAAAVRRLPAVLASGEGWPQRLLAEYALLHLMATANESLTPDDDADRALRDSLRAHLGVPVPQASVLAGPPTRDHWTVLAIRDTAEERLVTRRAWLVGRQSGRHAVVLSFAPTGSPLDASLVPGRTWDADLHWYPGSTPLRAAVGTRHAPVELPQTPLPATDLDGAYDAWSGALGRDPWLWAWPSLLAEAVVRCDTAGRWWVADTSGRAARAVLDVGEDPWELLAAGGGHPLPLLVEVTPRGVRPVAVLAGETVRAVRTAA